MLSLFILPSASLHQVIHILQWALQDSQHVVHTLCTCPTAPVNPWRGDTGGSVKKEGGPYHFWEQLNWEVVDGFDHYTYGWQKEYHPQDDTGSAKKQNIETLNWEDSTCPFTQWQWQWHNPRHWDPAMIGHIPTITTHSLRIDRESFLRKWFRILSPKSTPSGRDSDILHHLTASHECWHHPPPTPHLATQFTPPPARGGRVQ